MNKFDTYIGEIVKSKTAPNLWRIIELKDHYVYIKFINEIPGWDRIDKILLQTFWLDFRLLTDEEKMELL